MQLTSTIENLRTLSTENLRALYRALRADHGGNRSSFDAEAAALADGTPHGFVAAAWTILSERLQADYEADRRGCELADEADLYAGRMAAEEVVHTFLDGLDA